MEFATLTKLKHNFSESSDIFNRPDAKMVNRNKENHIFK